MTRAAGAKQVQQQQPPPAAVVSSSGSLQTNQSGEFLDLQRDAGNQLVGEWLKLGIRKPVQPLIQTKSTSGESLGPAEQQADKAAEAVTKQPETKPAKSLIVEDDAQALEAGQMRKSEFLGELRTASTSTAEEALKGTMWSAMGCPYIDRWIGHYEGQTAQHVERAVQKYTPEARGASNARDYIPVVTSRLRRGIDQWRETGEVPSDLPPEVTAGGMPGMTAGALLGGLIGSAMSAVGSAIDGAISSVGRALFKEREGGAATASDPAAIQAQLGSGHALDGTARSQMESAFGTSFSNVRIHTDAKAQQLSNSLNARAFTIGSDVAFGPGEYNPGTPVGDALIAHELAHVTQQQGGYAAASPLRKDEGGSSALEEEADTSAVRAVVGVWGGLKRGVAHVSENAMPRLKSGLKLQRCPSSNVTVRNPMEVKSEFEQIRDEILAGVPADDPARLELEIDLSALWVVYETETEQAGDDKKRQAAAQEALIGNVKKMKATVSLQVALTKKYKINFTARQSAKVDEKGKMHVFTRVWAPDELTAMDKVLATVPTDYLKNIKRIERRPEGEERSVSPGKKTPPPHSAAAWNESNQTLEIYDKFFQVEEFLRPGALLHEIGHSTVIAQDPTTTGGFTALPSPAWMALSDWKISTSATLKTDLGIDDKRAAKLVEQLAENKAARTRRPIEVNGRMVVYDKYEVTRDKPPARFLHYDKNLDNFVSDYARTHPAEDFAESFSRYLHDPKIYPIQTSARDLMGAAKWTFLETNYPQKLKGEL